MIPCSVALGALLLATSCSNDGGITTPNDSTPQSRWLAGMAYDDAQQRVLLFGGFHSNGSSLQPLNDLWAWSGTAWTSLGTGGPARGDMLLVWDSGRGRLVLYGGADDNGPKSDTWEWDGAAWSQRATSGPSVRRHFSGGYDKQRGRVVLYGGLSNSDVALTDTWEWDGTQWTQRASAIPSSLTTPPHNMVYSEARHALLMVVGSFSSGPTELWQWSGSAWSVLAAGPSLSMPVTLAATGDDEVTAPLSSGSTIRWSGTTFSTVSTTGPVGDGAAIAFDRARGKLVLFGGLRSGQTIAETWTWSGSTWTKALP